MTGDIRGGGVGDAFSDFIDDVKGFAASPEGMASMITKIVSKMTGAAGKLLGGEADLTKADFAASPEDLYKRLAGATAKVELGIPTGGGAGTGTYESIAGGASVTTTKDGKSTAGTASGWAPDNRTWLGTAASGRGDKYNQTATADIMTDIRSADPATRGSAVARALHNAGFQGENLRTMLKIAYRESHWITDQWVLGPKDTGGGILGVNQMPWTKDQKPSPYTQADVLDPQASAFIAMDMYKGVPPLHRGGAPNSFYPWKINGDPLGGIPSEANFLSEQALKKSGLGDIEEMRANVSLASSSRSGAGVAFNNTFNLSVPSYGGGSNGGIDVRRTASAPRRPPRGRDEDAIAEDRLMLPVRRSRTPTGRASSPPRRTAGRAAAATRSADVPSVAGSSHGLTTDTLRQQFAYEWFQSGEVHAGWTPVRRA